MKQYKPIHHIKPEKIAGIKIRGRILESNRNEFKFIIETKNKDLEEKISTKIHTIKNKKDNYFNPPIANAYVNIIYLTKESLIGLYKDSEKNLPYEITSTNWNLFYRQSIKENKKEILENLKKSEIKI